MNEILGSILFVGTCILMPILITTVSYFIVKACDKLQPTFNKIVGFNR